MLPQVVHSVCGILITDAAPKYSGGRFVSILTAKRVDSALGNESCNLWNLKDYHDHCGLPFAIYLIGYDLYAILQRPWLRRA